MLRDFARLLVFRRHEPQARRPPAIELHAETRRIQRAAHDNQREQGHAANLQNRSKHSCPILSDV